MLEDGFEDFFSQEEIEIMKENVIESDEPKKTITKNLEILFERAEKRTGQNLTEQEKKQTKDSFIQQIEQGTEQGKKQLHDILKKRNKSCCFSEKNNSLVMWSHYAKEHQGVCIEYDFGSLPYNDCRRLKLFPIIYQDELFDATPYIQQLSYSDKINSYLSLLACIYKAKEWEYEAEWRLIYDEPMKLGEETSVSMPVPSKIILGAKVKENDPSTIKIKRISEEQNIPIAQMELAENRIALEVKDL